MNRFKQFHAERWFAAFLCIHLLCWTFIPFLVRYNLPLDSIEGTTWGHQLEWGYDKNPFLNGWLTALAVHLGGPSGWMVYLFSQLSVVACFWAVWQLAKNMLSPLYALAAVLVLECVQYYNLHAIDFNDNTLELGLWGLTIYFFYRALRTARIWPWVLTGLFAGFGLMAKYYTGVLLASMLLFMLIEPSNRKQFKTLPPYLGLLVFLVIIIPHAVWLFSHDFITVRYMIGRTRAVPNWFNHVFFPAQFAWQQLQVFIPALVLLLALCIGKKSPAPEKPLSQFDRDFLFYIGLEPFILTLLLSIFLGIKLRAGWGMPLLSLWSIIAIYKLQPNLTVRKYQWLFGSTLTLMALTLTIYSASLIRSPDPSSANFPGKEIARAITKSWQDTYHTPLRYVAGSRWIGGNISFYSSDHPASYIEWNKKRAPWINLNDLQKNGAVFVWEVSENESLPDEIKQQFPRLSQSTVQTFDWKRNPQHLEPIKIGVAFLPPENLS